MKISLVNPCRNERGHILEFLDSLLAQDLEPGWEVEILVADGMSNDGTRDVLLPSMRTAPHVRLIDNAGRIVSTGLNAAIGQPPETRHCSLGRTLPTREIMYASA
jgi:glycosyltransferase involved in cell wall biosynthesis